MKEMEEKIYEIRKVQHMKNYNKFSELYTEYYTFCIIDTGVLFSILLPSSTHIKQPQLRIKIIRPRMI